MIHLRIIAPADRVAPVLARLTQDAQVMNMIHAPGTAITPPGDLIECDIARVAVDPLLAWLRDHRLDTEGSVTVENRDAWRTSAGLTDADDSPDRVIWESVTRTAVESVRPSWTFYAFLCLAVALSVIAVKLDSVIVVIAAMVVSPDFSPIAGACLGMVRKGYRYLIWQGAKLLLSGFAVAVVCAACFGLVWAHLGWITLADLLQPRPQTDFIWTPDRWSFLVAVLAGCAGILAMTSSYSNALIGVFIAVTTVPAAGNLAFALAVGTDLWLQGEPVLTHSSAAGDSLLTEVTGSLLQLALNLAGMVVAGVITLRCAYWAEQRAIRRIRQSAGAGH